MSEFDSRYPGSENIYRKLLPNGITCLAYENNATESVVIEGVVRAGALAESRANAGLAGLTAAALMRGTRSRSFEQIYEALESNGADLGFSGGYHTTGFAATCLVEDVDLVLGLLAESLRQPTFPAAQVARVRGQIMTGLQMRADDTRRMARLAFNELLYGNHPYGRSSSGYLDSVPGISREELAAFHSHYYGPQEMVITLVGGLDPHQALERVTAVFGDWENANQQPLPKMPAALRPDALHRVQVTIADKSQSDIVLGLPGPKRSAPDYADASLMNTILGVFGMMGRIGQKVREEQGLAYYAYSSLQGGLGPAPWTAVAGVAPENVQKAIDSICAEIKLIQNEPVSTEELADSQAYRTGSMPVGLETNSGLAGIITDMEIYDLGLDYLQRFPELMREVTPARVQAAAQKYLSTEQLAVAVAGPKLV